MNKIFFLIIILSFSFSQKKIFWDLGISINPTNNIQTEKIIKPLISNTKIAPKYKELNTTYLFDLSKNNLSQQQIIKLLYIKEQYAYLIKYINHIESNHITLNDDEVYIVADALYRLGHYDEAILKVNSLSKNYPEDEKYFLEAIYNKKLGNLKIMNILLDNLIANYPDSEYIKLAKLQINISK